MDFYLIYIGVITILLCLDYSFSPDRYNVLTLISLFVIVAVTCLRFEVGYDYNSYIFLYDSGFSDLISFNIEFGFCSLVGLLHLLGAGPAWMFACFGIAIIYFLFRGLRLYTNNVRIALLIFLLIPGLYLNSLSIIRQSLAIVIMFNAYYYLFNKRYIVFLSLVGLSVLFHYSTLLIVPFFLLALKIEKHALLFLLIVIPLSLIAAKLDVFGMLVSVILGDSKYAVHFGGDGEISSSFTKLLVLNVSILPYLFFYKKMDRLNRSLLCLAVIGLAFQNLFAAAIPITRMSYYFRIFEAVLLGNLLVFFKVGWSRIIMCILIFVYFFVMFYSSLRNDYTNIHTYPKLTPYKTLFQQ